MANGAGDLLLTRSPDFFHGAAFFRQIFFERDEGFDHVFDVLAELGTAELVESCGQEV